MTVSTPTTDDDERCPLCPAAGPPTISSVGSKDALAGETKSDDEVVDLVWIACSKCHTWFHSCCLLLADSSVQETIPQGVRYQVETNHKDESPFFDWTIWLNKWYCLACLEKSRDPSVPTLHPLVATTKANFPPRQNKRKSLGVKRSPSATPLTTPLTEKKSRTQLLEAANATPEAESSRPKRQAALHRPDYHALHHHISTPTGKWLDLIGNPEKYNTAILDGDFPRIPGEMVSRKWIESRLDDAGPSKPPAPPGSMFFGATRQPIIVRPEDGGFESMGGRLPGKDFTVQDVAKLVGPDRLVDVIDVATQSSSQWTLKQWAEYVRTGVDPTGNSSKVYNIISLEITGTELAKKVKAPQLVREIDWVDNFWHFPGGKGNVVDEKKQAANGADLSELPPIQPANATTPDGKPKGKAPSIWPKVQLYCLMGMKGSWTDWHVDFAASSVYYTIHSGSKVFYFIRPTEKNLKAYNEWSGSYEMQQNTWLGDMCDEVRRVVLVQGDTMIIPAGYIHAVYTPMNSIVFGGNFVHSYDIPAQLRLRQIEIDTKVPQRFRFPFFDKLCWYVAERYCNELRHIRAYRPRASMITAPPHPVVLEGLVHLAQFLITQADIVENPEEEDKKRSFVHGKIPQEMVKDPSGLARELLWRAKRELGQEMTFDTEHVVSVSEGQSNGTDIKPKIENGTKGRNVKKMKLAASRSRTSAFSPLPWDQVDLPPECSNLIVQTQRPTSSKYASDQVVEEAEQVLVTHRQVRTRVRDSEDGTTEVERQEVTFVETRTTFTRGTDIKTERSVLGNPE